MDPDTAVSAVKDQQIAVYDLKRLATPGVYLNEVVVYAVMNTFESLPHHKFVVSQYLSGDLKEDTAHRYKNEYKMHFDGYDLILIPLCFKAHWTLAIVHPKAKEIEFFDSFHYKQAPNELFNKCKEFMEQVLESDLTVTIRKDLPRQYNLTDCGLYTCKFAEHAVSGINLDFNDANMNSYRIEYANKIRILKPDEPEYLELRNSVDNEMADADKNETVDDNEMIVDDANETLNDKPGDDKICKLMARSSLVKHNQSGIFSYEESMDLQKTTDKPFIGKDLNGKIITYNTNNDWRNMLSFFEIMNHFNPNHKTALNLIEEEIRKDPMIAMKWNKAARNSKEDMSPYNFRWHRYGNFQRIKTILSSLGIKLLNNQQNERNTLKKDKKKLKAR